MAGTQPAQRSAGQSILALVDDEARDPRSRASGGDNLDAYERARGMSLYPRLRQTIDGLAAGIPPTAGGQAGLSARPTSSSAPEPMPPMTIRQGDLSFSVQPDNEARKEPALAANRKPNPIGHPGLAESFIPVWGSGRAALADYEDGNYFGAALNGGLALSDAALLGLVGKIAAKGGFYAIRAALSVPAKDLAWKKVRGKMGRIGMLEKYQHGHHAIIPHKEGWGKHVPDRVKNNPLNIKGMPSREVHGRIHGSYKGKPRYDPLRRYWYGTPAWWKVLNAEGVGRTIPAIIPDRDDE